MPRRDFTQANILGNWFIFTDSNNYFRRVYPGWLAFQTYRNSDHALESAQWAVWLEWDTRVGGTAWVEPKVFHENVAAPFIDRRFGDTIPAGAYNFSDLQLVLRDGRRCEASNDDRLPRRYLFRRHARAGRSRARRGT